ncbi:MAG TPA: XdhC family protein [Alphaproteobacteria bacterium]|nr:XdhC family protein [Alphaproteobacteria bacterium]
MNRDILERLVRARRGRRIATLVTDTADGRQLLIGEDGPAGTLEPPAEVLALAREWAAAGRTGLLPEPHDRFFVQTEQPEPRLVVVGAVHIAQALMPMARLAGFDAVLVDPRTGWSTPERFPDCVLAHEWPDDYFAAHPIDRMTAVVTLTHDEKLDDPALRAALNSPTFYIGALGSRRTAALRRERLLAEGFDEAALARISGPAGLAIGAVSPAEIAVSILAEVIRARRAGGG